MLAVVFMLGLGATAATGCESTCSTQANRCYTQCAGADRCTSRCGSRQNACVADCDRDRKRSKEAKQARKAAPCEVSSSGVARPCSERERVANRNALSSAQAKELLCRDAAGNLTACEDDVTRAEAQYAQLVAKCRKSGSKAAECASSEVP